MVHFNHDPFLAWGAELGRLQRHADRFVSSILAGAAEPTGPAVNLYHSDEGLVLVAQVPGLAAEDLDIRIEDGSLVLEGTPRPAPTEKGAEDEGERNATFLRRVRLPFAIDAAGVEARLEHGLLVVRAPRKQPDSRSIKIDLAS